MMRWIDVNKIWGEFMNSNVGVQIEVRHRSRHDRSKWHEDTAFYLIGELNELGGVCDDCAGIYKDDMVLRMRTLVSKAQIDGVE